MGYKVNDIAYTQYVALASIEAKVICHEVEAYAVLGGIICDSIAEGLSKFEVVQNRR
jgi:hypothetical protein